MKRTNRSSTLYAHPFSKAYWRDAAYELTDVRMLIFAALMIALRVAMKNVRIILGPGVTINTAFVINALGAMTFGPVVAAVAAAISDTLGTILAPQGPYFFPFIFIEIAGSMIFALFLYRTKVTVTRLILSRFCIDFFVNILLNAPIMMAYYHFIMGKAYVAFQLPHIIKNLLMFPVESFVLVLFLSITLPILYRSHMIFDKGEGLKFTKRHFALIAALFVVSSASTFSYFVYDMNTANHAKRIEEHHPEQMAEINTGIADAADLEDGQIVIMDKVYKKFLGDTTVLFNVYQTSPETDMEKIEKGVRVKKAIREDPTLTLVATGTATLVKNDPGDVSSVSMKPAE